MNDTPRPDIEDDRPSRSQQRRDALAILVLAEQLVSLPATRTAKMDLPDDIGAEIARVRKITAHGARKREMAYLAKLMRRHDDDAFATARSMLGEDRQRQREESAGFQRIEALRDRLIDGDADLLTDLINQHPGIDRQRFTTLVRQARGERDRNKPPRAARELFRLLRDLPEA